MSEPRYFVKVADFEEWGQIIEDAYQTGRISEDEYVILQKGESTGDPEDLRTSLEVMVRVGILGKVYYN